MDLSTPRNSERIAKFLSGNMSPEETVRFHEWLEEDPARQQELEEALRIWQMGEEESLPDFDKDVNVAWKQVSQHIQRNQTSPARVVRLSFGKWMAGAAAVALLGIAVVWALLTVPGPEATTVVYATGPGETLSLILPDSSRVWLNERSTLTHAPGFAPRSLTLEGEAFFEVRRDPLAPFTVESRGAMAEVLGTSFNIRAYPEEATVELTVETGKVAFSGEGTRLEIPAGISAIYEQETGALEAKEEKLANASSWHTGKLEFDNVKLEEVRVSFERLYGIRLEAEDTSVWNCHFTGSFEQAEPAELAESIAFSLNLQLVGTDSVYILRGTGCRGQ